MIRTRTIYLVIIMVLAVGLISSLVGYYSVSIKLSNVTAKQALQIKDQRMVDFLSMFVKKVIKAEGEISFETRLELENSVRNLGDTQILAQWKKFVDSKDEKEAQTNTKNLIELLVDKISLN